MHPSLARSMAHSPVIVRLPLQTEIIVRLSRPPETRRESRDRSDLLPSIKTRPCSPVLGIFPFVHSFAIPIYMVQRIRCEREDLLTASTYAFFTVIPMEVVGTRQIEVGNWMYRFERFVTLILYSNIYAEFRSS